MALAFAIALVAALVAAPSQARTFTVLHSFGEPPDGASPAEGSLVQDNAGNLYGATELGGTWSCGTVFKVVPKTGTETVLYSFTCGADGAYPVSTLSLSGSTLYGTTVWGGSSSGISGNGVVFEVNIRTGTEKVLHTFTGGADGGQPYTGPILSSGILYGTTALDGSGGGGVVYKLVPKSGSLSVLHSLDWSDGASPYSLTVDKTGEVLYGATYYGGSSGEYGVVFSLIIKSTVYKVLYNFTGGADGAYPLGDLALDPSGNLYGTTSKGGASGYGTVFKVAPRTGAETVLYNFADGADGGYPFGGVLRSKAGNLYGTTAAGGEYYGTVFELVKGKETVLHDFGWSDGAHPWSGVIMDSKGDLFGTTDQGGPWSVGVVWEITP
jgi:uncharacterized repeat protein (TIGR03803 family)